MAKDTVFVTNTGTEKLTDSWDGKPYDFSPGKAVEIPAVAAAHLFGFGVEDKTPQLARFGWAVTTKDIPEGLKRLAKFKIDENRPARAA
jgi:hypothetical protein